jgi:hypothetical protein
MGVVLSGRPPAYERPDLIKKRLYILGQGPFPVCQEHVKSFSSPPQINDLI